MIYLFCIGVQLVTVIVLSVLLDRQRKLMARAIYIAKEVSEQRDKLLAVNDKMRED